MARLRVSVFCWSRPPLSKSISGLLLFAQFQFAHSSGLPVKFDDSLARFNIELIWRLVTMRPIKSLAERKPDPEQVSATVSATEVGQNLKWSINF